MPDLSTQNILQDCVVCPNCNKVLHFHEEGAVCDDHGDFPRTLGILSFLPGIANGFDIHWSAARYASRAESKLRAAEQFLAPLYQNIGPTPVRLLDVGCGDGVHIDVLSRTANPPQIVGLDISLAALLMAQNLPTDWLAIHGDAEALPFADNSFDAVISFGVLAYLEAPMAGLGEIIRVTKPGGKIGVWFALKRTGISGSLFTLFRKVIPKLPWVLQRFVADLLVPFLGLMSPSSGLNLRTGSWRECREVILVNIAPPHLWLPSLDELEEAFRERGCVITQDNPLMAGSVWVQKQ